MVQFRTPIEIPEQGDRLTPSSRILLLGSCFTEGVGARLARALPTGHVLANPFGVLYNPASIAQALGCILDGQIPETAYFEGKDGLWHSWLHAGEFSATSRQRSVAATMQKLDEARRLLGLLPEGAAPSVVPPAEITLILTFGTARLFRDKTTGRVVANCHRIPAWQFDEEELDVSDIVALWQPLLDRLYATLPAVRVIFTVSPYRYAKYGMHGSQLSKARLHLAIDRLCRSNAAVSYFPSYEIILDELRDYRFYAADMLHPSEQAVDYVFEVFARDRFSPLLAEFADEKQRLERALAHRPLHPESEEFRRFQAQTQQKLAKFEAKWRAIIGESQL